MEQIIVKDRKVDRYLIWCWNELRYVSSSVS